MVQDNLPGRTNVKKGQGNTSRVLINLRDFSNYHRSQGGMEEALRIVDALSRLPPEQRPFGFIIEEPTGWLLPHEIGRLVRMIRLTMNRAGFPQGRFLVHIHWYFGMAEASQLACMANGADGVWAAVCKAGAQTGHACSTVTAVNLFKAGHHEIGEKYNLQKMCQAAREVTAITTREPCPSHEEVYGEFAFDIPYFMVAVPTCRYSLGMLMLKMGLESRKVRLNELSSVKSIYTAMCQWFGEPEESGWDPDFCKNMWDATHNHLLTGLSRDYNTALGLGHLYALVSKTSLPTRMVAIMAEHSKVSDYHPTVLEFIFRWNRLCAQYEGEELPPHPAATSKSNMAYMTPISVKPKRERLPFDYFTSDVLRNPVLEKFPRLFKLQVVSLLTADERKLQGKRVPQVNFYEMIVRLKLFLSEADSLGVLGLVDDFCIRKNHDYFFGEDNLWLQQVRGNRPKVVNKLLRKHMDLFPTI
jgi:HMGL-like